ncbi:DUF2993 domain-containing protein [Streptomyces avicenniae]|uniref:LmeA family phospholipid-binding protein n=1 Tax=Streptomyces avicenniae TaxID=500153 RepID=UPI00069C9B3E|nr:DUF2993 domain-containing protein [Streptomyces avicenniae]
MRALRILSILLGILIVLGIAADRLTVWFAENEVAGRLQTRYGLAEEPDVTIQGFPFLTQVAGRSFDHVDATLNSYEAAVDGQLLTVEDLRIELRDVEVTGGFTDAAAETATGSGLISYEELTRAYGELLGGVDNGFSVEFRQGEGDQLLLALQVAVAGQSLTLDEIPGTLVVDDGAITLEVDDADIPDMPGDAGATVREQLNTPRSIEGLPQGLALDSLTPTEGGLRADVSGSGVVLN